MKNSLGFQLIDNFLDTKGFEAFEYQLEAWQCINEGKNGIINAPTGFGKTYAALLGFFIKHVNAHAGFSSEAGLKLLWISPLRALSKDLHRAMQEVTEFLNSLWQVGSRNGDTSVQEKQRQTRKMPEILLITPESLHLLLSQKESASFFKNLEMIVVDEWHELLGGKRGVQVELGIAMIQNYALNPVQVWGISATIGNLEVASEVLLASSKGANALIKANLDKNIAVEAIIPDEIEKYPWSGHLGIRLAEKLIPIIDQSTTTLIFINTRGMSERWYQELLIQAPQLAGTIALHHGSIEPELRMWVEEALHTQKLKVVVCTASLDLGVDFRPVDTVIQVGSPKGVSRFVQRAGRSGHRPGELSKIYFLPTHALELLECAALKSAIETQNIEEKIPMILCYDVLIQFLSTLACGPGFDSASLYGIVKETYCYHDLSEQDWNMIMHHLCNGGTALAQYDDYHKLELIDGKYKIKSRKLAYRHRMQIGTIVSDAMLKVKFQTGGYIGMVEEWFISRLNPGDVFTLAGRNLELIGIHEMTVSVRKSNSKKSVVPSWMGSRMSLTANLGQVLRYTFQQAHEERQAIEVAKLKPLFDLQESLSHLPQAHELLVEMIHAKDGYHLLVYPFEGRQVHEALSAIIAFRIGQMLSISFSISMNDYGFELHSEIPIPINEENIAPLFTENDLLNHINSCVNSTEMAKRKFRDIAVIGGLVFQGRPGEQMKARHLQSNTALLFEVFQTYEPNNILLRQAYKEVLEVEMEEVRLRKLLRRIANSKIVFTKPKKFTPLSFPIIVDGLNRNNLSTEKLEERIMRLQRSLEAE